MFKKGEFIEIFIDTPINICRKRDVKGLYKKAQAGALTNFTGFDSPYEKPQSAEIHIQTNNQSVEDSVDLILKYIAEKGFINKKKCIHY